jgi:basic membrane lipoprotein Med (substrate-binding protein (PBP1-ABC) superfamily)
MYGLNAVKNNAFTGEVITFNLAKGGVGYTATNPALSASIIAQLEEIKQKIISGEIAIAATNAEAQTLPGFPRNLKAIDN